MFTCSTFVPQLVLISVSVSDTEAVTGSSEGVILSGLFFPWFNGVAGRGTAVNSCPFIEKPVAMEKISEEAAAAEERSADNEPELPGTSVLILLEKSKDDRGGTWVLYLVCDRLSMFSFRFFLSRWWW